MKLEKLEHFPLELLPEEDKVFYDGLSENAQKELEKRFLEIYNNISMPLFDAAKTDEEMKKICGYLVMDGVVLNLIESVVVTIMQSQKE